MEKLYLGDCLEVLPTLPDSSVDLLLTDIPYDGVNRKSNGLRNLDKGKADIITFDLETFVKESIRITRGSGYIFCGWGQISLITELLSGLSTRLCVWRKTNPSPMNGQSIWLSGVEFAVYFKKPNATFNEHCKNCVWDFPCGRGKVHPTEKPLALFKYLIEASSNIGDTVLDPCVGSGTTMLAAKELGRNSIGIELTPEYIPIIEARVGVKAETIHKRYLADNKILEQEIIYQQEDNEMLNKSIDKRRNRCSCGGRIVKTKSGILTCEDCLTDY